MSLKSTIFGHRLKKSIKFKLIYFVSNKNTDANKCAFDHYWYLRYQLRFYSLTIALREAIEVSSSINDYHSIFQKSF